LIAFGDRFALARRRTRETTLSETTAFDPAAILIAAWFGSPVLSNRLCETRADVYPSTNESR